MASENLDPERFDSSLVNNGGRTNIGADVEATREPLLGRSISCDTYSVSAAVLPFLFPALGGLLYGYDIGATSGATISLESSTLSGTSWYDLSTVEIGLQVSGSLYGALIGSCLAYAVTDFLGRRRELIFASVLYFLGAILTALAPSFPLLVVGRLIFGIGIGLAMHAAPMYIAETSPSQIRGRLISLKELLIVFGMLLGYVASNLYVEKVGGWRYMYASSSLFSLIMGIGMWWLPPSPRWLLLCAIQSNGNSEAVKGNAMSCLCRLRGWPRDSSSSEEINGIILELSHSQNENQAGFREIFQGKCLKALIIGVGLVFFQQVTGQPSVLYYAATILKSAGFSAASDATRVSILLGLLKFLMTGVAVIAVDRLGRKPLLLGGVSGIVLSLLLLSSYYLVLNNAPLLAVVALLLYVGCYQLSFGPIGWLMISEIFPLRLRGRGLSIAVLVNFASNALVTFAFSPLEALVGTGLLFAGFGVIGVLSLAFIFFLVPETKGLTLEEIEAKLL
ncbi:D-xylose-proton symporter-like 2 [Wolffia australiana]